MIGSEKMNSIIDTSTTRSTQICVGSKLMRSAFEFLLNDLVDCAMPLVNHHHGRMPTVMNSA